MDLAKRRNMFVVSIGSYDIQKSQKLTQQYRLVQGFNTDKIRHKIYKTTSSVDWQFIHWFILHTRSGAVLLFAYHNALFHLAVLFLVYSVTNIFWYWRPVSNSQARGLKFPNTLYNFFFAFTKVLIDGYTFFIYEILFEDWKYKLLVQETNSF